MTKVHWMMCIGTMLTLSAMSPAVERAPCVLKITNLKAHESVRSEVVELEGVCADPAGTLEVDVLTNRWYLQTGTARLNADSSWTYGPVYLSGQGEYNSHSIRVTVVTKGVRRAATIVRGIRRAT